MMLTMVVVMVMIELTGDCDEVILPIQSSTGDYTGKSDKTKVICANSKFELRNITVGEVA